jgi:hypothetical protein
MLAAQKHSVTQTGATLGGSDASSFAEAFRKSTGRTPSFCVERVRLSVKSIPAPLQTRSEMNAPANVKRRDNLLFNTTRPLDVLHVLHQRNDGNDGQERLLFQQAESSGVYYPETLKSMRLAFDFAWNQVSSIFDDPETARQILAAQILHHADRGEHKAEGLAAAATDDLLALTEVCDRHHPATGGTRANGNVNRDFAHFRTLRQI